ncbi:MAG: YcxB family protein [Ruminococcaceae bacterium]|nr:YcxB family protein [Oscillospiraceae bacterium]
MNFRFQIALSEHDYLQFNIFHTIRSPYGAKIIRSYRISNAVIYIALIFLALSREGFTTVGLIQTGFLLILLVIFQLLAKRFLRASTKSTLKRLKKAGKLAFSPFSTMEFLENSFIEESEDSRTETKYSSIERISVVEGQYVFLHLDSLRGYILPVSCFESHEQHERFLSFMSSLGIPIDHYKSI